MNPFYTHSHNHHHHLSSMAQSPAHHFVQQSQPSQQSQFSQQPQTMQQAPSGQSNSSALVNAAAQFYARSSQDQFNRRANIPQSNPSSSSPATPPSIFGGIEDSLFARAAKQHDNLYMVSNHHHHIQQLNESEPSFYHHHQQANPIPESNTNPFYNAFYASHHHHSPSTHASAAIAAAAAAAAQIHHNEIDIDPRELESFAEKFKQRRIKLGVTQADVGQQLSKLKLPGVGSLSQSTICRFESLTLSHNNMIALKPVLHSWLEQAEADARFKKRNEETMSGSSITNSNLSSSSSMMSVNVVNQSRDLGERKRKRTSIAAPEKRSLEAFFSVQPRPSGEKIAQIADKLDLKKNVVRVWFCNQRQKQKRMKFAAIQGR